MSVGACEVPSYPSSITIVDLPPAGVLASDLRAVETRLSACQAELRTTRTALRETQSKLQKAEHDLERMTARYQALSAERFGPTVTLASGAVLDLGQWTVSRDGQAARFTAGEWAFVRLLLDAGRSVTSEEVTDRLYGGSCVRSTPITLGWRVRARLGQVGAGGDLRNTSGHRSLARYELAVVA